MSSQFTVSLKVLISHFNLEVIHLPKPADEILIETPEVNRPGIQFSGFFEHFDNSRIQIIGHNEYAYLSNFDEEKRICCIEEFFSKAPALVVITRGQEIPEYITEAAKKYAVALTRTSEPTSGFMAALIADLNIELAPRVTRHGVLVEVYGEGILLLGESGVGKSETAIELIKRGHRLIADDAVEIRRVSAKTLVGTSPDNIRHFMELRGVGIINAARLFGIGAVKLTEKIGLIVQLEQWDSLKAYDRMGMTDEYTTLLGINVPSLTIPVKPGRNLAIIIEVAAMNYRQKRMGFNAAHELLERLGMQDDIPASDLKPTNEEWGGY